MKCLYYRYLIEKVTSTDVRTTNISHSLPHKMAESRWYEEITSLSPYVYRTRVSQFQPRSQTTTTRVRHDRDEFI